MSVPLEARLSSTTTYRWRISSRLSDVLYSACLSLFTSEYDTRRNRYDNQMLIITVLFSVRNAFP